MRFSLMLFSGALEQSVDAEYRRAIELARAADRAGFEGIWLPERHLTRFGAPYPNPLLVLAAMAATTERLALRAGSIVAPLHDPLRLAEDLSVLDNLSGGRIEAALASGWHPNDFIYRPENYAERRAITIEQAGALGRLWGGAAIARNNGLGEEVTVALLPKPTRARLPIWLTAAGTPDTFAAAGRDGFDLLTHVLGGDLGALETNIAAYRQARRQAGMVPGEGRVALMLHTFLAEEQEQAYRHAQGPFTDYLLSIAPLSKGLANARSQSIDLDSLEPDQLQRFAKFQFERLSRGRALIGTPEGCVETVARMKALGVDEIACLVDFGISGEIVQEHLISLIKLRDLVQSELDSK
jgi:natural product biosynthesis luciferase-like monooxygenase protein